MKINENLSGSMQEGSGSQKNAYTKNKMLIEHIKTTIQNTKKSKHQFFLHIHTPDQLHQRPICFIPSTVSPLRDCPIFLFAGPSCAEPWQACSVLTQGSDGLLSVNVRLDLYIYIYIYIFII